MKIIKCHCCGKPSTDANGNPKSVRVCWNCIRHGASVERKCAVHQRENPRASSRNRKAYTIRGKIEFDLFGTRMNRKEIANILLDAMREAQTKWGASSTNACTFKVQRFRTAKLKEEKEEKNV